MYEADCWHHLQNVWIEVVVLKLGQHLTDVPENDLAAIPFLLRVTTDVANLRRAAEKYFDTQADYAKVSWRTPFLFQPSVNANSSIEHLVHTTTRGRAVCSIGTHNSTTPVGTYILWLDAAAATDRMIQLNWLGQL